MSDTLDLVRIIESTGVRALAVHGRYAKGVASKASRCLTRLLLQSARTIRHIGT